MRAIPVRGGWRAMGLPARVLAGGMALVLVVLLLVFGILSRWAQRSGDAVVRRELEQSADVASQILAGRQRSLTGGARVFVQGPYFRAIVAERRADDILDQTFEAAEQLDADWVFIVDERGMLLAKSDEPGASGGDMSAVPLVAGALQGRIMSGSGVSRDSLLFQAVAVPIVVPGGAPIGALVATKMIDSLLARDVKAATSAEIVFFVRDAAGNRIAASTLGRSLGGPLAAEVTEQARSRAVLGGVRYATQGAAVTTAGGEIIGGFVVLSARDAASAEIAEVRRALLLAGLAGVALAALAAFLVSRRVARPVRDLTAMALRAADGDYGSGRGGSAVVVEARSEIAALDDAVHLLVAEMRDRQALVSALTASVPALSRASAAGSVAVAQGLSVQRVQGALPRVVGGGSARVIGPAGGERTKGEPAAGDLVADRYVIDALVGMGELTTTYRARDRAAGAIVALKRLRTPRAASDIPLIELVREEVRAVRPLAHRNVIRVHDAGDDDGVPFVTMDYVEGIALERLLRASGPMAEDAVLSLAKQLCRALVAAESLGIVHGDLSPKQLLLAYEGALKVGDFAPARIERRLRGSDHADALRHAAIPQLAGATVGSPEYMAPEQMLGEAPTARTDVYAAGVVLYECVTGATPFRTDSPLAFLAQKLGDADSGTAPDAMRTPAASRSRTALVLRDVIGRMILPEAERRPASARALLELLERAG